MNKQKQMYEGDFFSPCVSFLNVLCQCSMLKYLSMPVGGSKETRLIKTHTHTHMQKKWKGKQIVVFYNICQIHCFITFINFFKILKSALILLNSVCLCVCV